MEKYKDETAYIKDAERRVMRLDREDPMLKINIMNEISDAMGWQHKFTFQRVKQLFSKESKSNET